MKEKDCPHHHVWEFDGKRRCLSCGKLIAESKRHPIEDEIDFSRLVEQLRNKMGEDSESQPGEKSAAPELLKCPNPKCGELSLFWNESLLLYECLNPKCGIKVSKAELESTHPLQGKEASDWYRYPTGKHAPTCTCADCTQHRVYGEQNGKESKKREDADGSAYEEQRRKQSQESLSKQRKPSSEHPKSPRPTEPASANMTLVTCDWCRRGFLLLNKVIDQYECDYCGKTVPRKAVEIYIGQVQAQKDALDKLKEGKSKGWIGWEYWDEKGKWIRGRPGRIIFTGNRWLWFVLLFILVSLAITFLVNYFHPGSRFAFFVW